MYIIHTYLNRIKNWFSISESLQHVDVLVACQPVISDGRLAPVLAQQWEQCLVLWATPEEQTGEMISGNSLVLHKLVLSFGVSECLSTAQHTKNAIILSCNIPSMKQFFPWLSKISAMTQQLSTSCVLSMFPGIPFNYNLYNCGHLEMAWKINDESLSLELFQLLSCTRLKKYIVF